MTFTPEMIDDKTILALAITLDQANFEALLKFLASYYHNGPGLIEDPTFDLLIDLYQSKYGPYTIVGAAPQGTMVDLPYYLGSLDKFKKDSEISGWVAKHPGPYIIEDKIDGLTLLLLSRTVSDGKNGGTYRRITSLYTRGGGVKGMDVSHLVPYMKLPVITEDVAIRGEIVINKEAFARIGTGFKNARNLAAGAVKAQQSFNPLIAKELSFYCYRVLNGNMTKSQDIAYLTAHGFLTPSPFSSVTITKEQLDAHLLARKAAAPYEMDGLVIYQDIAGEYPVGDNPKHVIAFKMETDTAVTTVLEVTWEASKEKLLKPVVHYDTVKLSGADLQRASGYNARFIVANNIGPGAKILLTRSGDVIPKILSVITPSPSGPQYPDPAVHGTYTWNANQVEFVLEQDNDQVITNKLRHFLETLEIKNAGPGRVKALVDGGINTIKKLITATPEQLKAIPGIGPGLSQQYVTDLKAKLNQADLAMIMDASGIFEGIGQKRFNMIITVYPQFLDYVYYEPTEIARAVQLVSGFNALAYKVAERMRTFGDWLKEHSQITIAPPKQASPKVQVQPSVASITQQMTTLHVTSPNMSGLTIVFSGFRDVELEKRIVARGGKVTTSVSGNTSMLVMKDITELKGKALEAQQRGIALIGKEDFLQRYF